MITKHFLTAMLATFTLGAWGCGAQIPVTDLQGKQTPQSFQQVITKTVGYKYLLYLPADYAPGKTPLLLFLHGAGERGSNLEMVKVHGVPKLIAKGESFPFIVVSPQCPEGERWDSEALDALVTDVATKYAADPDRIYVTGLSMGGYGTWALGIAYPEKYAALAPVCGGGEAFLAPRLRGIPVWAFHGAKDKVVPMAKGQEMVDALTKLGGSPKFTVYPEAGHDSWTETYNNPELYRWLLEQKRKH